MQIGKAYVVAVRCTTTQGRHAVRQEEGVRCLDCPPIAPEPTPALDGGTAPADGQPPGPMQPPPWTDECKKVKHRRQTDAHVTLVEAAPDEAVAVRKTYAKIYGMFAKCGLDLGRNVYLVPESRKVSLDQLVQEAQDLATETTGACMICTIDFAPLVLEIIPGRTEQQTLLSLQRDVSRAVEDLTAALKTGDVRLLKAKVKATRDLADLLDGPAKAKVADLHGFAKRMITQLDEAADEGDAAVQRAQERAAAGAERFAVALAGADLLAKLDVAQAEASVSDEVAPSATPEAARAAPVPLPSESAPEPAPVLAAPGDLDLSLSAEQLLLLAESDAAE